MTDAAALLPLLPYYPHLSDTQKEYILTHWVLRRFTKGQFIHTADDCLGQILLLSGKIRSFLLSEEGREILLFRLRKNDTCVLSADCILHQISFDTHMLAEEDCELLVLPAGLFSRLAEENIYVKCYMYQLLTERFSAVIQAVQQILFLRFDKRLASFLLEEFRRTGNPEIRMTQEQIAQNTNSAREVVARMLKRFSEQGLVHMKRGSIRILDPDALRKRI